MITASSIGADEVDGCRAARQMQAHEVRGSEQLIQRTISCLILLFDVGRQARALRVDDAHTKRERAQRQLATDLAEADDAELSYDKA